MRWIAIYATISHRARLRLVYNEIVGCLLVTAVLYSSAIASSYSGETDPYATDLIGSRMYSAMDIAEI